MASSTRIRTARRTSRLHHATVPSLLSSALLLFRLQRALAFHPSPIEKAPRRFESRPTARTPPRSAADGGSDPLPFFAAPSFDPPRTSGAPRSTTATLRLPLGTLFDGRDYIFVTHANVRGYEWGTKEVNVLVEDLMDAALGSLGGAAVAGAAAASAAAAAAPPTPTQPTPTPTTDFELSQIVLVPTSDWDPTALGLGNRYDVYDGQQRLVTLNLLLAALRDSFRSEAGSVAGGGKRAVALEATACEVEGMLKPAKVRKEEVVRITLRKRDNVLLERILAPTAEEGAGEEEAEGEKSRESSAILSFGAGETPAQHLSKLTPREKNELLSPLSLANARILENFLHISDRLSLLSTRERLRLLDYVVERVHLLVCIPETSRIARNIVMSQGRKGMDNEAIDDFKGLVCFRYTLEEKEMYQTFDAWDALAAEPTVGVNGDSSSLSSQQYEASSAQTETSVGRDIISAACLLRASASLRTKIRSGGGDEVYEWERWLRHVLWLQNQELAEKDEAQTTWQGKDFFAKEIEPASIALYKFRLGQWDEFNFLSEGDKKLDKQTRNTIVSQLSFLKDIIGAAASAKEAEILVLELLLRAQEYSATNDDAMLSRVLDDFLPLIERCALWMTLSRPSPMQRHGRVFAILDAMEVDSLGISKDSTGSEDIETLKVSMSDYKFGASTGGKRLAAAILNRMNSYLMIKDGIAIPPDQETTIDMILPETIQKGSEWDKSWTEEQHEEWSHCLGNLALISKSGGKSSKRGKRGADSTAWEAKTEMYEKEPWPLTKELAYLDVWNLDAINDRQKLVLSLVELVWKE